MIAISHKMSLKFLLLAPCNWFTSFQGESCRQTKLNKDTVFNSPHPAPLR